MTDQLAAFAPRRVLDHDLLAAGGSWTQTATTLFVDLEGFTSLTERLGTYGSRGTEELSVLLRGFFGAATDAVTDHAGDPVAFGGDALTVLFDGPAAPALEAATSAAAAIGHIVGEVSGVTTLGGPLRLRTRIGIARGSVTTGLARSSRRCLPVQLGPGLDLAAAAEATAEPGEVVVDASARDATSGSPDPGAATPASRAEPAVLAQLASPWVVDRLTAGTAPLESHRRVTTAFARFPAVRPDGVAEFLTAAADLLELVDGWEGEVVQVSGGDKGVVAMVVFGAPLAHADDPMRAVEAMLRLRDREPAVAAGIATGPVFAALLGSRSRLFPTHTGLAVTTAARLMQLADPGDLLVDGATWAETSGRLRQRGEPSVRRLKGQRDDATVHTVDGWHRAPPSALGGARPPLVGRRTGSRGRRGASRRRCGRRGPLRRRVRRAGHRQDPAGPGGRRPRADSRLPGRRHRRRRPPPRTTADLLARAPRRPPRRPGQSGARAVWHAALSARLPAAGGQTELLGPLLGLPPDRAHHGGPPRPGARERARPRAARPAPRGRVA